MSLFLMAMNSPLISFVFLLNINIHETGRPVEEIRLTAVTSFEELEEIYLRTRSRSGLRNATQEPSSNNDDKSMDPGIKKELCKYIFNSSFFDSEDETVDEDRPEIRLLLKCKYKGIFEEIYKKSKYWPSQKRKTIFCKACHPTKKSRIMLKYEYENAYQLRSVADSSGHNVLKERVLRCVTKKRGSEGEMREYFVSVEYDINVLEDESYSNYGYMAARFIFTLNAHDLLEFNALAERTAVVITSGSRNIERLYFFIRRICEPKVSVEDDPLCKMRKFEKLRICASVLTSVGYEYGIKFLPDFNNISNDCRKRSVSFQTDEVTRLPERPTIAFEEWMIACSAEKVSNNTRETYYISRGYGHNKVFLYKGIEDKVYLDNYSGHVNIFDDDSIL